MKFIKFSLHDSKTIELIEKYFDYKVVFGYHSNEKEGITNFRFIIKPELQDKVKISYTKLRNTHIPFHYHENTKHVYANLDGVINLHLLDEKVMEVKNYEICKHEGCFIPPGILHALNAENARLLCLEMPPDENDFHLITSLER